MRDITITATLIIMLTATVSAVEYDLDQIRDRTAAMYNDILTAYWENDTQGGDIDITEFWADYTDITGDPELLAYVKEEMDKADDETEERRLRLLYAELTGIYAENAVLGLERQAETRLNGAYVWINGLDEPVYLTDYARYFFGDTDPDILQNMRVAKANFYVNTLNPIYRERIDKQIENVREMGYDSYTDFYFQTYGLSRDRVRDKATAFLTDTSEMFADVAAYRCAATVGMPPAQVTQGMKRMLFFGMEYDHYFPQEQSLEFTYSTLAGMGFDVATMNNVTVDDSDRPDKESRVACYPVDPPGDVRVNLKPMGGFFSYYSTFHEFGHVMNNAHIGADQPMEFRYLGRNDITECFAFLFENLFVNRAFLTDVAGMSETDADSFRGYILFLQLSKLRGLAVDVLYEMELYGGELADPLAYYRELGDEYGIYAKNPMGDESGYLSGDRDFYSLSYYNALVAEAQLRAKLEENFGERWFADPAAGDWLRDIYSQGNRFDPDSLCRYIGYEQGLDESVIKATFEEIWEEFKATRPENPQPMMGGGTGGMGHGHGK